MHNLLKHIPGEQFFICNFLRFIRFGLLGMKFDIIWFMSSDVHVVASRDGNFCYLVVIFVSFCIIYIVASIRFMFSSEFTWNKIYIIYNFRFINKPICFRCSTNIVEITKITQRKTTSRPLYYIVVQCTMFINITTKKIYRDIMTYYEVQY